jgi:Rieske Fe-S protein
MADETLDTAAENDPTPPSDAGKPNGDRSRAVRTRVSRGANQARSVSQQWREEFPYHWRADDVVTRRDTLRFLVAGTGALAAATGVLAIAGHVRIAEAAPVAVAKVGELAPTEWRVFNFPDQFTQSIIINLPDVGLVAYNDTCTHLSCAVLYHPGDKLLHCPCHDGVFDAATGNVVAGPPTRPLALVQLAQRGDTIYAVKMIER